jgi:hypothetical protein
MPRNVAATVITATIAEDLIVHVMAIGTTNAHVHMTTIVAGREVVLWTHLGHSVQISAVTMPTAALAVQEIAAAGTMTVNDAVDQTGTAEIIGAEPALSNWPPGGCVSVNGVSIVFSQIAIVRGRIQSGSARLRHLHVVDRRQS